MERQPNNNQKGNSMAEIQGQRPPIETFVDPHGRPCVRVPLDPFGKRWATLTAADYERVQPLTANAWRADQKRPGKYYVRGNAKEPFIARVVARAKAGEQIVHADGDTLNLLPENLVPYRNRKAVRAGA